MENKLNSIFIPYELADILKCKLEYDEPCLAMWNDRELNMWLQDSYDFRSIGEEDGFQFKNSMWNDSRYTAAPTWEQVFNWFIEKYNIHSYIHHSMFPNFPRQCTYTIITDGMKYNETIIFSNKEEAQLGCLKKIIAGILTYFPIYCKICGDYMEKDSNNKCIKCLT